MSNLLEPWVLLRLAAGLVAFALFARAALTAQRVLRHFDVRRATEGQLALEKRVELAATFARVGAVVQVAALALSALTADRLSRDASSGAVREVRLTASVRRRYAEAAATQREAIRDAVIGAGAHHLQLRTDHDWLSELIGYVHRRRRQPATLRRGGPI